MLKKTAGNRNELPKKKKKGKSSDVGATGSVRELSGMLYRRGRKPVSIEEMNASHYPRSAERKRLRKFGFLA
jgi:hypothetical protein